MADGGGDLFLCEFGSEVLKKLLLIFTRQLHGVRHAEDPEYIHRMRVSSRRLRAAMPVFQDCFPRKQYKQWLREIRRVTRVLGDARDLDVQILFLQAYQRRVDPHQRTIQPDKQTEDTVKDRSQRSSSGSGSLAPDMSTVGTGYILHLLKSKREALQPRIADALDILEESGTISSMDAVFRATMKKRRNNGSHASRKGVQPFAAASLSSAMEELLSFEESLYQPDARTEHHAMRIAAKRLRYRLEIFRPLYGTDISEAIRVMKRLQTLLGELHDCDIWIEMLPGMLKKENPLFAGEDTAIFKAEIQIRAFIDDQKEYRNTLYNHVIRYWKRKTRDEFFPRLQETIMARAVSNTTTRKSNSKKS
jgi:CHAD domain-containing protein